MVDIETIKAISSYLTFLVKKGLFYILWIQMKKQKMFIDPSKVIIEYIDYPLNISNFNVLASAVIIRTEGLKGFTIICTEKLTIPRQYNVLFIKKNQ